MGVPEFALYAMEGSQMAMELSTDDFPEVGAKVKEIISEGQIPVIVRHTPQDQAEVLLDDGTWIPWQSLPESYPKQSFVKEVCRQSEVRWRKLSS